MTKAKQKKIARWAKKKLGKKWAKLLWKEFTYEYMRKLLGRIQKERKQYEILPPEDQVFRAYRETPPDEVKAVIIGQDPYPHDAANGLAFSCDESIDALPASLKNIFQEVEDDVGFASPAPDPDLGRWARQGVFLLNTTLTVRKGDAGSHSGYGWRQFTEETIKIIGAPEARPKVFLLWGSHARGFKDVISPFDHNILEAYHPSPLSAHRGFFGCRHFSKTNEYLRRHGYEPIEW